MFKKICCCFYKKDDNEILIKHDKISTKYDTYNYSNFYSNYIYSDNFNKHLNNNFNNKCTCDDDPDWCLVITHKCQCLSNVNKICKVLEHRYTANF
jgi:hypothetical protein